MTAIPTDGQGEMRTSFSDVAFTVDASGVLLLSIPSTVTADDYGLSTNGGLAAFFWPIVIAFWLGRRAKSRRDDQIESEVQRQLDQERRG